MKKRFKALFAIFGFVLAMTLTLSGCATPNTNISIIENTFYSHTIYSLSGGKVTENIVINFDALQLTPLELEAEIFSVFNLSLQVKTLLESELGQKLTASFEPDFTTQDYAVATEKKGNKIAFTIYYYSQKSWQFFNKLTNESAKPEIVYRLFDLTRIDRSDMVGTVTSLGGQEEYFGNYFKNRVFALINSNDDTLLSTLEIKSVYAYATQYSRRRTNAPMLAYFENLYFHIWDTSDNNANFAFWYNLARVESWYVLSLILAFGTAITVFVVSKLKKDKVENINIVTEELNNEQAIKEELLPLKKEKPETAKTVSEGEEKPKRVKTQKVTDGEEKPKRVKTVSEGEQKPKKVKKEKVTDGEEKKKATKRIKTKDE